MDDLNVHKSRIAEKYVFSKKAKYIFYQHIVQI